MVSCTICRILGLSLGLVGLFLAEGALAQQGERAGHELVVEGPAGTEVTFDLPTVCLESGKEPPPPQTGLRLSSSPAGEPVRRLLAVAKQWEDRPDYRRKALSRYPLYEAILSRAALYQAVKASEPQIPEALNERWQRVQDLARELLSDELLQRALQRAVWAAAEGISPEEMRPEAPAVAQAAFALEAPYTQLLLEAAEVRASWMTQPSPGGAEPIRAWLGAAASPELRRQEEALLQRYRELKGRFDLHFTRGLMALKEGAFIAATRELEQACRALPRQLDALHLLGAAYFHLGRLHQAVEAWETVIGLDAGRTDAHFNLALAYEQLGRPVEAVRAASSVTALRPHDREAQVLLARLAKKSGG